MSTKPPTEQENQQRPLLPYEIANVRRWLRLDPDLTEEMGTAHRRRQWLWKQVQILAGFGVAGFTLYLLVKEALGGS